MEMRGTRGFRIIVAEQLRARLPAHIEAGRAAWGLTAEQLPMPVSAPDDPRQDAYFAREVEVLDRWPLIAVASGRLTQRATDFTDDFDERFRAVVPMRVFAWVRAEGRDEVQDIRDDFATCVRACLLADPQLGTAGDALLDPTSLLVDPSRPDKVKGERWIAGAFIGFDLAIGETLTDRLAHPGEQPRDTVSTVTASSSLVPSTP
jgi:hypothetical protein